LEPKKEEFQEQNRGLLVTIDDGERVWEKRCYEGRQQEFKNSPFGTLQQ
jgi:hypothetical protein